MSRSFADLVRDIESHPENWEVVQIETVPSLNRKNRGGVSVQERLRHAAMGEELVRHTLFKPNGALFAEPHYRPAWKGV